MILNWEKNCFCFFTGHTLYIWYDERSTWIVKTHIMCSPLLSLTRLLMAAQWNPTQHPTIVLSQISLWIGHAALIGSTASSTIQHGTACHPPAWQTALHIETNSHFCYGFDLCVLFIQALTRNALPQILHKSSSACCNSIVFVISIVAFVPMLAGIYSSKKQAEQDSRRALLIFPSRTRCVALAKNFDNTHSSLDPEESFQTSGYLRYFPF